jgi:hypothetical protein
MYGCLFISIVFQHGFSGGELRKMFLQQGCRHRRKGKRLYKGKFLKKSTGAV